MTVSSQRTRRTHRRIQPGFVFAFMVLFVLGATLLAAGNPQDLFAAAKMREKSARAELGDVLSSARAVALRLSPVGQENDCKESLKTCLVGNGG